LRIIKGLTPRSGAVDADPGQIIFGGASSPVIRQKKNITIRKITRPFTIAHPSHVWTHLFQCNHINQVFVQSAQINENACNIPQYRALVFV